MLNHFDHAATPTALETADTTVLDLIHKGHDIQAQIDDLQAKLDIIDQTTDTAFHARNELAEQYGQTVFRDIDAFAEAVS